MNNMLSLFLSQSYKDSWADYQRLVSKESYLSWDYIILTASDDHQADGYRMQLEAREGYLPKGTHFAVIPDEGGVRVGSGGATLSVLRYIFRQEMAKKGSCDFSGIRVLVIHSGGDSKRIPIYSAMGKLFSPVPHVLPDGRSSTLFDEFMIAMASVPSRIREGMVLLSGDVILLFNPLQIDFPGTGAAAISFKEDAQTGQNHGVFLNGDNGYVRKFLHKQPAETLRAMGAVNEQNCVDIDTGAIAFAPDLMRSLYSLVDTEEKYTRYVNPTVRLSLYGDFLYPMAEDSTLDSFYLEKPEGSFCPELREARTDVWEHLRPYRIKLLRLAPAKFIHFGTTRELMSLMNGGIKEYAALGWTNQVNSSISGSTAGYDSVLSNKAKIGAGCYLESSYVHRNVEVGSHVCLSHVEIYEGKIPDSVVMHMLKLTDGKFVCRIYGITDNPKDSTLFGLPLDEIAGRLPLQKGEPLWEDEDHALWSARLYPECDTAAESIRQALILYHIVRGNPDAADAESWAAARKVSLHSSFQRADQKALIEWRNHMKELVQMDRLAFDIRAKHPASSLPARKSLTPIQRDWLKRRFSVCDFAEKIRLQYYLGRTIDDGTAEDFYTGCFRTISSVIREEARKMLAYNEHCRIRQDRVVVRLPLRVNWGGGWSDTPPICCETGGTVLNAAILINGEYPVEVTVKKIPEYKIVFDSRDMDVHGEFTDIGYLQSTGDPFDPYILQKACLLTCGIIPEHGGNLLEILHRMGGGFELDSEVHHVPKGSGLGTSSILSAACVKAMLSFIGTPYTEDDLYAHVLVMEQIMSTGGGWQDQVGGVTPGIKYITSRPGLRQVVHVDHVVLTPETQKELQERFCLIYTGQRRLARNLLRDVIGRYIGNEPDSLYALNEIQRVAALMRFELERGHVDDFAQLLERHWSLSKKIDGDSTNTLIEQIFAAIDPMIEGRMICGAGGGGFLQLILKKGFQKSDVQHRLKEVFQDNPVGVWDCTILF